MSPFLTVLLFMCLFSVFYVAFAVNMDFILLSEVIFYTVFCIFAFLSVFFFLKLCPNSGSTVIVVGVALFWGFWVGGNIGIEVNEQNLCYYSRFTVAVLPYKHFYFRSTISS